MGQTEWVMLVLAILFVVTAAFLVAAETAIGRVSRSRAEEMARDKPGKATDRLRLIVEDRARYVNVMLFLHSAFAVAATALVTYLCVGAGTWGPLAGLFLALLIMTGVMFIALGVAPRTLGRQHADRIALRWGKFARGAAAVLGPFVSLLILIGNALTPGKGYREGPFASQAELRELVDQAEADQVIEDDEAAMLHSVFELGDTIVREVMVPRTEIVWIERHKTLRQALSLALRSGYSRIPVIGDGPDDVVGVFYLKDVVNRVFEHRESEATERIDSRMRPAVFVPDSKLVDDLLRDLQSQRVHMAIAVDEYGGTAGLVTIEDVLEEIVGEITDEYDQEPPEIEKLAGGGYRLSARLHVEDAGELLGFDIDSDSEGVDTVAGLIAKRLGKVALPGSSITTDGWVLTAEQAARPAQPDHHRPGRAARAIALRGASRASVREVGCRGGLGRRHELLAGRVRMTEHRSGFVAIVGRPNAGKSTLTNALVGQKVAITSSKPQTTRRVIRGMIHLPDAQVVLVDTPGIHRPRNALGERLNALVEQQWAEVDAIALCLPADEEIGPGDRRIAHRLAGATRGGTRTPVIALVTKTDRISRPNLAAKLTAVMELGTATSLEWAAVVPVSAQAGDQLDDVIAEFIAALPVGPALYPDGELTDEPEIIMVAELIREAALEGVSDELPHSIAVVVEEMAMREDRHPDRPLLDIHANLFVERSSQKAIVIGAKGARLRDVGTRSRAAIEAMMGTPVYLDLHVKVAKEWQRDPKQLRRLGF